MYFCQPVLRTVVFYSSPKRSSLPDIPLTPREREILQQTSDLGLYDNTSLHGSKSSDSVTLTNHNKFDFRQPSPPPPPKPPLPQNAEIIIPQ